MKKINLFVLTIALLAVFVFTVCSSNYAPLDEPTVENSPFDDTTRSDSTKNDTAENDSTGGMGGRITDWETVRDSIVLRPD